MGAPEENGVSLAGEVKIIRVLTVASDQAVVFDTADGLACTEFHEVPHQYGTSWSAQADQP
jgi:hypothetical protein